MKPQREPSALPADVLSPADMAGEWVVARVLCRHEKTVAQALAEAGVQYFLPLSSVTKLDAARHRRRLTLPVLPGYVFLCVPSMVQVYDVRASLGRSVCGVIRVRDQARIARELSDLHAAASSDYGIDHYPEFSVGRPCRIKAGPMQGVEGFIVHRGQDSLFVLQITFLGTSVALEAVDPDLLEAL